MQHKKQNIINAPASRSGRIRTRLTASCHRGSGASRMPGRPASRPWNIPAWVASFPFRRFRSSKMPGRPAPWSGYFPARMQTSLFRRFWSPGISGRSVPRSARWPPLLSAPWPGSLMQWFFFSTAIQRDILYQQTEWERMWYAASDNKPRLLFLLAPSSVAAVSVRTAAPFAHLICYLPSILENAITLVIQNVSPTFIDKLFKNGRGLSSVVLRPHPLHALFVWSNEKVNLLVYIFN